MAIQESNYDLGMRYLHGDGVRKNKNKAFDYLWLSAEEKNISAMGQIADIYARERKLSKELDEDTVKTLNAWACILLSEGEGPENQKRAYTLFRICSPLSEDAMASYAYCKFNGIGIKKNLYDAFEIIISHNIGDVFTVLKSIDTEGKTYSVPKSPVRDKVIRKHTKVKIRKAVLGILRFPLHIFFWPYITFMQMMCSEDEYRAPDPESNNGGAAYLLGFLLLCGIYLILLNIVIDIATWLIFDWFTPASVFTVLIVTFILSIIYFKLSGEEIDAKTKSSR